VLKRLHVGLPILLAGILVLVAARSLAIVLREQASAKVSYGFVSSLIERLFSALAATRWSIISRWRVADMTQLVSANSERLMLVVSQLMSLIQAASLAAAYMVLSLFVSWKLTLFAGLTGLVLLAFAIPAQKRAARHGEMLGLAYRDQSG
jgi:ABC-type bacteriocin/lantibiotic exporter with double-glycine peptidase domain